MASKRRRRREEIEEKDSLVENHHMFQTEPTIAAPKTRAFARFFLGHLGSGKHGIETRVDADAEDLRWWFLNLAAEQPDVKQRTREAKVWLTNGRLLLVEWTI